DEPCRLGVRVDAPAGGARDEHPLVEVTEDRLEQLAGARECGPEAFDTLMHSFPPGLHGPPQGTAGTAKRLVARGSRPGSRRRGRGSRRRPAAARNAPGT